MSNFDLPRRQRVLEPDCGVSFAANIREASRLVVGRILSYSLLLCAGLGLAGCNSTKIQLGPISVTDPSGVVSGQLTSVIVNATADVSVSVQNDKPNLGVDWNLTCGGSPNTIETTNVCGTLNPVHVGSNISMIYTAPAYVPVGNTVTLTAQATTDPSVTSSVTLTIVPQPVTLAWTGGIAPPAQMAAGGSQSLSVTVSNDPTAAGVNWTVTCGSASCGTFTPGLTASGSSTVYVAPSTIPSGGSVTVTATSVYDQTKSLSATISVQPITVAVAVSPSNKVPALGSATLTATVSWDPSTTGVTWGIPSCSAGVSGCGTITGATCAAGGPAPSYTTLCTATYEAPHTIPAGDATLPVTVTATSVADTTKTGSSVITVGPPPPISVTVVPESGALQVNATTTLTATVAYDYTNSGVNWQCSPGTCNPVSSTALPFTTTYTAPSAVPATDPTVITATSIAAPASDPTGTGETTIEIVPAISVAITQPATITAGQPASFSATVSGDPSNAGVDWSATCFGGATKCGTFVPAHSASGASVAFTAPNNQPWSEDPLVTITATSTASETAPPLVPALGAIAGPGVNDPVQATVTPVPYVSFVPFPPSALPLTNPVSPLTINLIAVSVNDSTNRGVDWSVCSNAATCGAFFKIPGVPATASSAAVAPVYSATLHAASGQTVAYLPPTSMPTGGTVTINVASTANATISASQAVTMTSSLSGVALSGTVMTGNLPVSGASVELYQAGNTGYGSAAYPLVISNGSNSVTTNSTGNFAIPAGYSCTSPNSLLYLVATGGTPNGQSSPNGQLGLMTALGPCSNLNSSIPVVVNELTTVATVWALAPFTGVNSGGFQDYQLIGSSASNYGNGLANAFATVNNLVNITTGEALSFTPAGGSYTPPGAGSQVLDGQVPQDEINTLADAINTCATTSGGAPGDGSACDEFFFASNVNPPGGIATHSNEPASILPAIMAVAQYPGRNSDFGPGNEYAGSQFYNLIAQPVNPLWSAPYLPNLVSEGASVPTDWTISLTFTGGGLEGAKRAKPSATAMAIDGAGSVWIANRSISSVTEMSNLGVPISPFATGSTVATAGGFTGGGLALPRQIAIDPFGSVWVLNGNSTLSELDPTGTPISCVAADPDPFCGGSALSSPFSGAGNANNTSVGLAIDANGDAWVADSGSPGDVAEYAGLNGALINGHQISNGAPISPAGAGYTSLTSSTDPIDNLPANPNQAIAIDDKSNVWILDQANFTAVELNSAGTLELIDHGFQQIDPTTGKPISAALTSSQFADSFAIDSDGDLFLPNDSGGQQMYELFACGSASDPDCLGLGRINNLIQETPGINTPIAIDGANNLWVVTQSGLNGSEQEPASAGEFSASGTFLNQNANFFGYVNPNLAASTQAIAVDASGNLWLLLNSNSVTEFIGVATPTVTPLSKGKLGAKP